MRWDAVLHPVGPLPPAAYWLRRAIVLGLPLLILIVLVVVAGGGSHAGSRKSGVTATPASRVSASAGATPSAAEATSAAASGECPDSVLRLSLTTRATAYPAGSPPQFVVTVTNVGKTSCSRDVGVDARKITVTSGTDRIWSSADCTAGTPDVRILQPGKPVELGSAWDRRRSVTGCATASPAGRLALPGLYVGTVRLGTLGPSAGAPFTLS
jgi:hypothetical protein